MNGVPAASGVGLLTLPASHPYVEAVRPSPARPVQPDRVRGFAPDPAWRPDVLRGLADETDLVHVHFGYDHVAPVDLDHWLDAVRSAGLPLVVTVHDLRNPHHSSAERHDELLRRLVPAADAVITLTPGAAREVAARFTRAALVLPHPTLVDPARTAAIATEPGLVLLHLKSLRANLQEPERLVEAALAGAVRGKGRLRVDLHPEVADDPRLAFLMLPAPGLEVCRHPRFDDAELEAYLRRGQVTVLPQRWGTHSGWLELARDLGTRVVAGSGGYYAEQWPEVVTFRHDEAHGLDGAGLADVVTEALQRPVLAPADRSERLTEAEQVRRAHADLYVSLLSRPAAW